MLALRMWELKKSRIRLRAYGWAVKMEGREGNWTWIALRVMAPLSRMIKDIIMRSRNGLPKSRLRTPIYFIPHVRLWAIVQIASQAPLHSREEGRIFPWVRAGDFAEGASCLTCCRLREVGVG